MFGVFDQQQPLPSDYGSPGSDPSSLSPLAGAEGALPREYGTSTKAAPAKQKDISDFVKGVTTAVEESGMVPSAFQSSGKASAPTEPTPAAPDTDASKKWKVAAALALGTLVVGGTLWYGSKQGWFAPKGAS